MDKHKNTRAPNQPGADAAPTATQPLPATGTPRANNGGGGSTPGKAPQADPGIVAQLRGKPSTRLYGMDTTPNSVTPSRSRNDDGGMER